MTILLVILVLLLIGAIPAWPLDQEAKSNGGGPRDNVSRDRARVGNDVVGYPYDFWDAVSAFDGASANGRNASL